VIGSIEKKRKQPKKQEFKRQLNFELLDRIQIQNKTELSKPSDLKKIQIM